MKLRIMWLAAAAVTSLAALSACKSDEVLGVENKNNPDVARAISTPDGIENVLKNGFAQIFGATHGSTTSIWAANQATALESYGSVANFGLAQRGSIPRSVIDNTRGNPTAAENYRDFQQLFLRGRLIANAIGSFDDLKAANATVSIGSQFLDLRARSYGFFNMALANGEAALMYDSVGVVNPKLKRTTPPEVPALVSYGDAMVTALQQIDSAIAMANAARTATGSTASLRTAFLPVEWMRTVATPVSLDDYIRVMRSTKARLRAGVARNPTERAAVNWTEVVNDASNGITADWVLDLNNSLGWSGAWLSQMAVSSAWSGMTPAIIGMADTTSGYANWIALDRGARAPFLIQTPDARFPQGSTRAAQTAASPTVGAGLASSLPSIYFRARAPGEDNPGEAYGNSYYDHVRFFGYRQNASAGRWVWMSRAENDMLWAEGLMRLNRDGEAVPLINRTRAINKLGLFPAGSTKDTPAPPYPGDPTTTPAIAPGGPNSCVPRTPTGPGGTLVCGSMYEAMKWEKRMETLFTGYSQWFVDSRGWGDLPLGSPEMYPVPYQEMDARNQAFYNSVVGDPKWQALTSTYGFGVGSR
ncbi:MAG: hypothetical protein ACJ8AD_02895 [Gemmatimonadaceae bacterium]